MAPDLDLIGYWLQIPYNSAWGHRGATHSLLFALGLGTLVGAIASVKQWPWWRVSAAATLVVVSHGVLDALTNGGLGVAFFWPLSSERFFFAWRPLPVSAIGARFFSLWQLKVLLFEALLFSPLIAYGILGLRKKSY
jgi:inner membrane protein